jgi:tRNA threonylcarbamoyladenosine biosynthesis protein TsaB
MSLLLHLETATDICSVGLSYGEELISLVETDEIRDHARVIALMIRDVMDQSGYKLDQLDAVSISEGPGSYTSLRVGTSAAKALCFGLDKPLITINTLYSLALAATDNEPEYSYYCSMIDARRMEVYLSLFGKDMVNIIDNQAIVLNETLFESYLEPGAKVLILGNGSAKALDLFKGKNVSRTPLLCSAKHLVKPALDKYKRGIFEDIAYFSPNYIKSPNITQAKNKLL